MSDQNQIRILLTKYREHTVCARYVGFRMTDITVCEPDECFRVGDIIIGKVTGVRPQMNAAFVSLREGEDAWLNLEDPHSITYVSGDPDTPLKPGDEILVQITREAHGNKRLSVSANLMFSGRMVLLMTGKKALGVSVKIPEGRKKELRRLLSPLMPENYGVIVRSAAEDASVIEITEELSELSAEITRKLELWKTRTVYSVVERGDSVEEGFVLEHLRDEIDEIVTDLPEEYDRMQAFLNESGELSMIPLRLYDDPKMTLSKVYSLETSIEKALARRVYLKSGAYLVIDQTEAMTVIDVNSGKMLTDHPHRKVSKREAALAVNREAAAEIARQIRLRNVSGIIVADFIDLADREDQKKVLEVLKEQTADDPAGVHVVDMTALQLCEMTRKRVKKPLREQLSLDAPIE